MNDSVTGIILKQSDYRDRAVLLQVLTETSGKLSFVVRGARKISSKTAGYTFPYTKLEFLIDYKEQKTIFTVKSARVMQRRKNIYKSLEASAAAELMCEVADSVLFDCEQPHTADILYRELDQALEYLDQGKPSSLICAVFLSTVLNEIGNGPAVDGCAVCGESKVTSLSAAEGGFLCGEHAALLQIPAADPAFLKQFRLVVKASAEHIPLIETLVPDAAACLAVMVDFFRHHAGIEICSYTLYQSLFNIE